MYSANTQAYKALQASHSHNGGMPQGSLLYPISFIVDIDDLSLLCNVLKYVDGTTLSEIIGSNSSVSDMQTLKTSY